jgi:hypothetical protein
MAVLRVEMDGYGWFSFFNAMQQPMMQHGVLLSTNEKQFIHLLIQFRNCLLYNLDLDYKVSYVQTCLVV